MNGLPYRQDIAGCLAWRITDTGLAESELAETVEALKPAIRRLTVEHRAGILPHLGVPEWRDDLTVIQRIAQRYRRLDTTLVLGIGGSSLGGQAVCALVPGGPLRPPGEGPRVVFLENIDPDTFAPWLDHAERENAGFVVISKSGGTAETVAQMLAAWERMKAAMGPEAAADRFTIMTEPTDNPLSRFARGHGMRIIDHDAKLGGRFSVLSTGALPATIAGLDATALRLGAQEVATDFLNAQSPVECPAVLGAALNLAFARRDRRIHVMLSYADALRPFALWHAQLWGESLGKGGHGTTPVAALGPVDQHSQLQLWLDGPRDKFFTVLQLDRAGTGPMLTGAEADPALAYLGGRTMGDLLEAEQRATAASLMNRRCPVRILRLPRLDERALGALFM
ncbi:MAG: glucose-6-phosphate isomerase, partial [Rhodospirillaceae bacterium]|nr:glucose-6-phosphate isomerase [Rhodospirillaceae bacterium]